ncbi:MAG: hypothetical protein K2H18_00280, partial [Muribaculaceae bacterium]|nr:hypothetical protein [Muribaculaceae bacterium]
MLNKSLLIAALAGLTFASASAEVLVNESFAYPVGNLASKGNWVVNGTAGSYPMNIVEENLTYPGYQDKASGNALCLDMSMGRNSVQNIFAVPDTDAPEAIAYSALIRVDEFASSTSKYSAVIVLAGSNSIDGTMGDAITSTEGAGLYIKKGSDESEAILGVSVKGNFNGLADSEISWSSKEVDLGDTVLIAITYGKEGDDYVASLFINPTEESTVPDAVSKMSESTLADIRGIALCQRSAVLNKNPQVTVDELRVATDFKELFSADSTPVVVPTLNVSENPLNFGQVYTGITYTKSVIVKGTDLDDDITVCLGESGQVKVSAETISKEEAMSENGFELTVTLTPEESRYYTEKITLTTPKVADRVITVEWHPVPSLVAKNFSELCDEDSHDMTSVYVYTGEAVVTFVESYYDISYERVVNSIFVQDATGGAELRSALGCGYQEIDITGIKEGDVLTNIAGYLIFGDSGLTFIPRTASDWEVIGHDRKVDPMDVSLRDLAMAESGYIYGNQLVRIRNVRFPDEYYLAGDYHGLWNSQKYEIYDGTLDAYEGYAWMWCNRGADYFKQPTTGYFNHKWNLTGIVNNYYPVHVSPRSYADFE